MQSARENPSLANDFRGAAMYTHIIEMKSIRKAFPGNVVANDDCFLAVKEGEIHAVIGENGAGKSTLMNILFGLHRPDEGTIVFKGHPTDIPDPRAAKRFGIEMVHQHFMLVPSFTVLQNITLGYELRKGIFVDTKKARKSISRICEQYGLILPLDEKVKNLPIGIQQRVEIVKALYKEAEILILDEPTAVLIPQETDELFRVCLELVRNKKTILFISHKLKEVMRISDRITVMRKGRTIISLNTSDTNEKELARLIIGENQRLRFAERIVQEDTQESEEGGRRTSGELVLEVKDLTIHGIHNRIVVDNVTLSVRSGEILGIAGVEGNGQTELLNAVAGIIPHSHGEILLDGKRVNRSPIQKRRFLGLRFVPEDRMKTGLCLGASISENLFIDYNDRSRYIKHAGCIDWRSINADSEKRITDYRIAVQSPKHKAGTLSGGNMQKVVMARELTSSHRCLVVAHPTRGVDIGSADFIYQKLVEAKEAGVAVLLVSADLDELFLLSDRLIVMYEGRITAEFSAGEIDSHTIGLYMTGAKQRKADA